MLLDNVPDYLFWLTAGALAGLVVVGINSTYRGEQLAQLIDHTDCQVLVTSTDLIGLLDDAPHAVPSGRLLVIDQPGYEASLDAAPPVDEGRPPPSDEDLFLLIFTSGSTGMPKAVRCTQGRIGRTGAHVAGIAELTDRDVVYAPLPFFHAASMFTGWASAVNAKIPISTRQALLRYRHGHRHPQLRCDDADLHRQGAQLHPRRARVTRATQKCLSGSRSATRRRSRTSASSPGASTARSATATDRPRA